MHKVVVCILPIVNKKSVFKIKVQKDLTALSYCILVGTVMLLMLSGNPDARDQL